MMGITNPDIAQITPEFVYDLEKRNLRLELCMEVWMKLGLESFDSRSDEWNNFMDVLHSSGAGKCPIVLMLWPHGVIAPKNSKKITVDITDELSNYISTLDLQKLAYENRAIITGIGCFAESGTAISTIVDVLKSPPPEQCPAASSLDVGQPVACLVLLFENAEFNVNVFRE